MPRDFSEIDGPKQCELGRVLINPHCRPGAQHVRSLGVKRTSQIRALMSANGTKQTHEGEVTESAQGRIADVPRSDVCLGLESGSAGRFWHRPLMTQSGTPL